MSVASVTQSLVAEFQSRPTLRAGSLITTVFGDSVAPRGGSVWLGSLIRVMREFGVSERLVRTSVFRLSRDGWFEVSQIGRRSYYSLSDEGKRKFERATRRIYSDPATHWSGEWTLLMLGALHGDTKDGLKKELTWLGFAPFASNVMAHPAPRQAELAQLLAQPGIQDAVVAMTARSGETENPAALLQLVSRSWNLEDMDQQYREFVSQFRPVLNAIKKARTLDPLCAFQIRTLLIQEYRKVLLRDPLLPSELLPAGWHGKDAYELCRDLYLAVHAQADHWLSQEMETADGALPPPVAVFFTRFGGL